jgi:excinuclease ABC subunit A
MDPELVVPNPQLSIKDGAIAPWATAVARGEGWTASEVDWVVKLLKIKLSTPWNKLTEVQRKGVLWGSSVKGYEWEGLCNQLMRRMRQTSSEDMKQWYLRYFSSKPCPACDGARLRAESRAVTVAGMALTKLSQQRIEEAAAWIDSVELKGADLEIAVELRKEIRARLGFLVNVGLGYLTLDRAAATLSGGESQRIRLASQIGSGLTGVLYVLDEPSIGLHQKDNARLLQTLVHLRDLGNTVIVVEHDEDAIRAADHVVDMGPGAGVHGGVVVAEGTPAEIMAAPESLTGQYLVGHRQIPPPAERDRRHSLRTPAPCANPLVLWPRRRGRRRRPRAARFGPRQHEFGPDSADQKPHDALADAKLIVDEGAHVVISAECGRPLRAQRILPAKSGKPHEICIGRG